MLLLLALLMAVNLLRASAAPLLLALGMRRVIFNLQVWPEADLLTRQNVTVRRF